MNDKIIRLIKADQQRCKILDVVAQLNLPQCYVAAGFVRNLVWDNLHNKTTATTLNDVDVIYFDPNEKSDDQYSRYEQRLNRQLPNLNWQVRNQAQMHSRNKDKPYQSTLDAMSYWPEKETAVAVRKSIDGKYECISAFGTESLFNLAVTYNPKRAPEIVDKRIKSKGWLTTWPKLKVIKGVD